MDAEPPGWIARLVALCARNPWLTLLLVAAATVAGVHAARSTPLDALPDLSDTQVILETQWEGRSPDLIEDQITYPLTTALLSVPGVEVVRGTSTFGTSFVYLIFDERTDLYWARSRVLEVLTSISLPDGVKPRLGPDATGVGWVFEYALVDETGGQDLQQLRQLQDWTVRPALTSVVGVSEVASIGGYQKEFQVDVDPVKLRALGVSFEAVAAATRAANAASGGHTLEIAGHEQMIRARGYVASVKDLAIAPVPVEGSSRHVRIGDVATVSLGPATRRGIAELDGRGEVVGGVVIMRHGGDAVAVIEGVKRKLSELAPSWPKGVHVVTTYDRSELIASAVDTLQRTLLEEMAIVSLVILLFLMHLRSALVVILSLPIAVLLAFLPMAAQGLTANIMSLGGIAVAIGAMIDASVILIENVHKGIENAEKSGSTRSRQEIVIEAMQEVGPAIFFSLLVLTVAFLPVFTLQGAEGRLFRPLAWTKTWSIAFGALLAVTATPALVVLLVRGRIPYEDRNPFNRLLIAVYEPIVRAVVRFRYLVIALAVAAMAATVPAFLSLQHEFMPPLDEGTLLYMPTAPPGISTESARDVLQAMDKKIAATPEVAHVFGKMGRVESATDPAPLGMAETIVTFKPQSEWRPGVTTATLLGELDRALRVPGMPNVWWMPIQTRTEMLATGVRTPLGLLVKGSDLAAIDQAAARLAEVLATVPGTRSAVAERATGGFYVDIDVDREAASRFGVSVAQITDVVSMNIGGMSDDETVEGRARFPIRVRYGRDFREDASALDDVLIDAPDGPIPLSWVTQRVSRTGPDMIRTEDGSLVGFVYVDPGDRALAAYVEDAEAALAAVSLPTGVHRSWTGQFVYYERASARLKWVIPATLLIVLLLLYMNRRSWIETMIVMLAVPFSLIGAVWLLVALGYHMSVAVWVGLIALAGLDAETGIVMLLYLDLAHAQAAREGKLRNAADLTRAIVEGAARRIRPKMMTVLCTMLGLTPMLWSHGTGADMMKRIAAPMVGGLVTSFLLELTVYPAIYAIWKGRSLPR